MKVARSALPVTLAHWERAGVRETVMATATYIVWGGADAMAVSHVGTLAFGDPGGLMDVLEKGCGDLLCAIVGGGGHGGRAAPPTKASSAKAVPIRRT